MTDTDVVLNATKFAQNNGFRRNGINIPFSGKPAMIPIDTAFNRYNPATSVPPEDIPGGFLNIPVNRQFGIFPIAKGTGLTNKTFIRDLANNDVYNALVNDRKINDQEQPTNQFLLGVNYQNNFTSQARFSNYKGNSSGETSKVMHAKDSTKSNSAVNVGAQLKQFDKHPMVKEAREKVEKSDTYSKMFRR